VRGAGQALGWELLIPIFDVLGEGSKYRGELCIYEAHRKLSQDVREA
jgi:hypothetical protein